MPRTRVYKPHNIGTKSSNDILKLKFPLDYVTDHGSLEDFVYYFEKGAPCSKAIVRKSLRSGKTNILRYILQHKISTPTVNDIHNALSLKRFPEALTMLEAGNHDVTVKMLMTVVDDPDRLRHLCDKIKENADKKLSAVVSKLMAMTNTTLETIQLLLDLGASFRIRKNIMAFLCCHNFDYASIQNDVNKTELYDFMFEKTFWETCSFTDLDISLVLSNDNIYIIRDMFACDAKKDSMWWYHVLETKANKGIYLKMLFDTFTKVRHYRPTEIYLWGTTIHAGSIEFARWTHRIYPIPTQNTVLGRTCLCLGNFDLYKWLRTKGLIWSIAYLFDCACYCTVEQTKFVFDEWTTRNRSDMSELISLAEEREPDNDEVLRFLKEENEKLPFPELPKVHFNTLIRKTLQDGATPFDCVICMENITKDDLYVTQCGHPYHYKCLQKQCIFNSQCPICREDL